VSDLIARGMAKRAQEGIINSGTAAITETFNNHAAQLAEKANKTEVNALASEKVSQVDFDVLASEIRTMSIPVLEIDPISPANGQIWLLKYYELLRDTFSGADGSPLDSNIWEVVKTKTTGSTATHAATNKADVRGNRCQFNVAASAIISDGGKLELLARMKKILINWADERRVVTWKQQPYTSAGTVGVVLSPSLAIDGGNLLSTYTIRVVSSSSGNISLQMINSEIGIVYNQSFAHGKLADEISEFKLVIEPANATITLYQDGVEKLQAIAPNITVTSGWLYIYTQTSYTTALIRDFDDVVIE
jgi:hypothetical protein